ncbi:hypothetical protein BDN72DRAFT_846259, partial [Pluteus cervinus]
MGWDHDREPDAPPGGIAEDPRLLLPPFRTVREWEVAALGGLGMWRKAEEVIARRKRQGSWLVY